MMVSDVFGREFEKIWGAGDKNKDKIAGHGGVALSSSISPMDLISIFCSIKNTFQLIFSLPAYHFDGCVLISGHLC